jgi:hypothetical protein
MTAWLFSLPIAEDRSLVPCENCRWWDTLTSTGMPRRALPEGARSCRRSLPSALEGAVWPYTDDTDWWGSFKLRSDAESEPGKEEF